MPNLKQEMRWKIYTMSNLKQEMRWIIVQANLPIEAIKNTYAWQPLKQTIVQPTYGEQVVPHHHCLFQLLWWSQDRPARSQIPVPYHLKAVQRGKL